MWESFLKNLILLMQELSPWFLGGLILAGFFNRIGGQSRWLPGLVGPGWKPVLKATLIGLPLPLCSCSVLPVAQTLRKHGASRPATAAFLISTPQTGVDSIAASWALLGPFFAWVRPLVSLVSALCAAWSLQAWSTDDDRQQAPILPSTRNQQGVLAYGFGEILGSLTPSLSAGILIAALISTLFPQAHLADLSPWMMYGAVILIGIPMYICATASIPLALILLDQGVSPGAAVLFLLVGPVTNAAALGSMVNMLGRQGTMLLLAAVSASGLVCALLIDTLAGAQWSVIQNLPSALETEHEHAHWFSSLCAVILTLAMTYHLWHTLRQRLKNKPSHNHASDTEGWTLNGMSCQNCVQKVTKILEEAGADHIQVSLPQQNVAFTKTESFDENKARAELKQAGFPVD